VTTPDVLRDPETEPEAAHLRNVLRQIGVIAESDRRCLVDRTLVKIREVAREALARPATNGAVIDCLVRENGDLQSEILELKDRIRRYRETLIAKGVSE
jgi:hypothetical protein